MLRRVRSRSIRILAITGIAEIDIAVARKNAEQHALVGLRQVVVGHVQPEAEAGRERHDHAHRRRDQRGAAEVACSSRRSVSSPVSSKQQHHAERADHLEQVELRGDRREQRGERPGAKWPSTWARARCPAASSPTTAGRPTRLASSAPSPRDEQDQRQLDQQQEDRVSRERLEGLLHRRSIAARGRALNIERRCSCCAALRAQRATICAVPISATSSLIATPPFESANALRVLQAEVLRRDVARGTSSATRQPRNASAQVRADARGTARAPRARGRAVCRTADWR